jgi:hypothetical protein
MKTIYKYSLTITDRQVVKLPQGATILSVKEVRGELALYALVSPDPTIKVGAVVIRIFGTGNPIDTDFDGLYFLDSVPMSDGYVWHVYITEQT